MHATGGLAWQQRRCAVAQVLQAAAPTGQEHRQMGWGKAAGAPRTTAPYHTLEPLPTLTSPMMLALGATNTLAPRLGRLPPNVCTLCALLTAGGGGGGAGAAARGSAGPMLRQEPFPRPPPTAIASITLHSRVSR